MLMLASDLRIFSDKARAAFLFVKVGLSGADMGALYLLPRIVGLGKATELVYFGDTIDAQEAHRIGLANRVVPGDTLMDEAYKWANRLKDGPLYALGVTKELLEYEATSIWKPLWRWRRWLRPGAWRRRISSRVTTPLSKSGRLTIQPRLRAQRS